ncbi:cellulose biosynthesis cyclic di-GMP-binding regulatory protein BcsB [Qipengyuania qiaonensis]|uniref:Cellulose biosynthesis cyclic di-GMP-binding regulatory protein BcsB n=1 Tax=Qipengyuania qiaonensis TaxID=2867240 RepID=A0ABS7J0R4_9SPHN|nr:cellulose biosynthesis cyclic di-GMP-binding regulatory protein BcsB [Qipengyuania qiaonensis]MBX7480939.1 cellulose biosynthesis cyclic di-GMP-binding regulatory protein BcsB [Qipengyuania qiaonensis]
MTKQKFLCAVAAAAMLASAGIAQAPVPDASAPTVEAPATPDPATPAPLGGGAAPVARFIALDELGFENGFEMAGLSGARDLYFPLPATVGVEGLRLVLPYRADSSFSSRRAVSIVIGGRTQYTTALPEGFSEGVIDIPIDPALIDQGYLTARIVYSGAITEDRCIDQRLSGAYLAFGSGGGLEAQFDGGSLASISAVSAAMPRAMDIALPEGASTAQAAAALTLMLGGADSRLNGAPGQSPGPGQGWRISRIGFAPAAAPALGVRVSDGVPAIQIGGKDPVASARLLKSRWKAIAASPSMTTAGRGTSGAVESLTLADLGADTSVQSISDRGQWNVAIPAPAIPAGQRMTGMIVDVAVAEDSGASRPVIAVLLNGFLLASAEAEEDGRTQIDVDLPEGLTTSRNNLEVSVVRQTASGDCKYAPQGYPAQLLPSSRIKLGPADALDDFSDLPTALNSGFTLVVPNAASLAPAAAFLGPLASGEGPVSVSYGRIPAEGAVVYVGRDAPPGSEPTVRFDQGKVEIAGENGETIIDRNAIETLTTIQILEQGGRPLLWIRPGADFAALESSASPPVLGYGNVAFLAADQLDFAFNDERERLIDIRYPDESSFAQFFQRYRLWFIGLGWLLLTLGFVYLLRRVIASNKPKD